MGRVLGSCGLGLHDLVAELPAEGEGLGKMVGLIGDDREEESRKGRPGDENKEPSPVGTYVKIENGEPGDLHNRRLPSAFVFVPHPPSQEDKPRHEEDRKDEKQENTQVGRMDGGEHVDDKQDRNDDSCPC